MPAFATWFGLSYGFSNAGGGSSHSTADVDVERGVPVVTGRVGGLVDGAGRPAPGAVAATAGEHDRHDADDDDDGDDDVPPEGAAPPPLGLAVLGAHGGALVAGPGLGHGESQVTR